LANLEQPLNITAASLRSHLVLPELLWLDFFDRL